MQEANKDLIDECHLNAFSKKEAKDSIESAEKIVNFIEEKLVEVLK